MRLGDVMTRDVDVVSADATLAEAAAKMRSRDVGALPVLDGHKLVGMLTDRDITVRATAEGRDPKAVKARDVATPDVVYGFEDQTVEAAAKLMAEKQIRRLVVLSHEQRLVGIVSLGDIAKDARDPELAGEALEKISQPAGPTGVPARPA